jgi:queuine/archaeosine tRNA-ribosyltransferase
MLTIIKECRAAILSGTFAAYRAAFWEARQRTTETENQES